MTRSKSRRHLVAVLSLCLPLASCFTTALWSFEADDVDDDADAATVTIDDVGWRLLLTPFTLLLDCATCCFQADWVDDDPDDGQSACRRRR
jgi:hypothetical protein